MDFLYYLFNLILQFITFYKYTILSNYSMIYKLDSMIYKYLK